MKRGRVFAHIYEINSLEIKGYLLPGTDSLIQSHTMGISNVARIGSYVIVNSAGTKLVGIVNSLQVTEPEKLYWIKTKSDFQDKQVIRTITITLIGQFHYTLNKELIFERGINVYPSIDEEVLVPTQDELNLILNEQIEHNNKYLEIGVSYPTNDIDIKLNPVKLFSRHCGVFGSTGNGKSCTVTVLINELLNKNIDMPIFIFDINGEYSAAFKELDDISILKFCGMINENYPIKNKFVKENLKFNHMSFSRTTFRAILKPSERTQVPALNFAIDTIRYLSNSYSELNDIPSSVSSRIPQHIKSNPEKPFREYILGDPSSTNSQKIKESFETLDFLRILSALKIKSIDKPIGMSYLAKIICDRWSITPDRNNDLRYDAFRYSNVSSICDRILELCRDPLFRQFCDTKGGEGIDLDITTTYKFSDNGKEKFSRIIIFDLSLVPQEYISTIVDSMLERHLQYALQNHFKMKPHLLVLDEAHHYLGSRNINDDSSTYLNNPPGERIAKEGRKYGLHILVSSQRPREMSSTIIAQLGTVISHALTHENDRSIITGFGTYNDRTILNSLSILPRREAIVIGQAISMPTRFRVKFLEESKRPASKDPLEAFIKGE
ncbi:ATP-binding protein [Candidatus Dojkabacteria bacterium]|nr:ATP-binding protein [Candidatus Dojkabacteria bacterium]